MFRLNRITINGFKDPNRVVDLNFAEGPITVIYGENGSGKTTLLKVLHAILSLKSKPLEEENISQILFEFENESNHFKAEVLKTEEKHSLVSAEETYESNNTYTKRIAKTIEEIREILRGSSSILFGINRGIVDTNTALLEKINSRLLLVSQSSEMKPRTFKNGKPVVSESQKTIDELIKLTEVQDNLSTEFVASKKNLVIDNLRVGTIEKSLINAYNNGQKSVLTEMSNAFFATIDNAINIKDEVKLPKGFTERFKQRKNFFLSFVNNLEESVTKNKLKGFLESDNQTVDKEGPVFKSLLKNLLLKAEQDERENLDLKAVNTIVAIFNQFVIHQKKLVINSTETYIQLQDDQRHELEDLSSGERHLLSFLTLFLILGRDRDIFLIDEPEISMSIKWQRRLLPLLAEFSPHAQIIVATHSPEIADGHTEYLKELV